MTPKCKLWMTGKIAIPVFFIFFVLVIVVALNVAVASTIVVNGTSIQEAVDKAQDGDVIIVYPGTYRENIDVGKPVSIRSYAGAQDTVIEAQYKHLSIFHITANHVNISGFTVGSTKMPGLNGIYLDTVRDCNVFNNSIKFNYKNAIHLHCSSNNIIRNNIMNLNEKSGIYLFISFDNILENNTANSNEIDGIALESSYNNIVENNTANLNKGDGVDLTESNNNTLKNNVVNSNEEIGIYLYLLNNNTVKNNIALNNSIGIALQESSKNIIGNNTVDSNEIDGIALVSSYDNIVENNTANLNKGSGVDLTESNNNTLKNNVVNSNEEIGIYLYLLNNNTVKNNIALNNSIGIALQESSKNIIGNNTVDSNEIDGITLVSSYDNIVENNTANLNKGSGVDLIVSDNNTIKNNVVNSNEINGIFLILSYNNIVEKNTANLNKGDGVDLIESDNNTLKNNIANSNEDSGIGLDSLSDNNTIEKNLVSNNLYEGIYLNSAFNNILRDNTAVNNRYGIYLNFSFNNIIKNNIAKSNNEDGFGLYDSSDNSIEKNIASSNGYGIYLSSSLNNIIKNNVVNSNNKYGIKLFSSDNNTIEKNIISNNYGGSNYGGIHLGSSFNNFVIENSIKANNLHGILVDSSNINVFIGNTISMNEWGVALLSSLANTIYHNNILNSSIIQAFDDSPRVNNWFHLELMEGNHWSDYKGTDRDGDGKGDTMIPHPGDDYDWYPSIEKNGWLTFLISPEYWDFGTVYQGRSKKDTFEIQNKGVHDLTILSISADPNIIISGIDLPMKISKCSSKAFNVTIETANLEGDVLRGVEIITDDKIAPNKTILIYGFVKPPVHDVRVTDIDFDSRIIKGQIDVFTVSISNYGSFDEHNLTVEFKDGTDVIGTVPIPELLAGENVTVSYHWYTKDAASGVHKIAIEVRLQNKDLLDSIGVKVNVLSSSEASTLIITNFERMSELWGENETVMLEEKLIVLSFNPCVNGIIINVGKNTNCSDAYESWKEDILNPEEANKVSEEIKQVIESKLEEYRGVKYIILVGDDRVIPFYRITDNSDKAYIGVLAWPTENDYAMDLRTANTTISSALGENQMLTDDFYVDFNPEAVEWADILHIPDMPVGRLVESPEEICLTIETFIVRGDSVNPDKIFLTAYDFMNDSGSNCARVLETLRSPLVMSKGKDVRANYNRSSEISDELLTNRSDIIAIFQHADHSHFILYPVSGDDESTSVTSMDISNASADLNGSIVYTMSCHSGLNVPPADKNDLVEAYISKKVLAYVAPTGYGIGSEISVAGHEKLLYYFTKYLCEGVDVGTALMSAKHDYYALEFDFDHIDSKVASTMIIYGLPMYRVNIEKLEKAESLTTKSVSSFGVPGKKGKIEVATLTLRPRYSLVESELGNYYYSEDYQSDSGKPIQPKVTWSYIVRDKKMLHGMVLKSASYKDEENFNPVIDSFVVSPTAGLKRIGFDAKNWYPSNFFKISTVGDMQFLIIISGQYNPRKGTQRLYNETTFDIYISAENEENPRPPEIRAVHSVRHENATNVRVNATDNDSGIYKVIIAYTDAKGEWREWRSKDLKEGEEGLWSCDIPTKEEIEFFIQAVDIYGNVAVDDNDGEYYPEKEDKLPGQP